MPEKQSWEQIKKQYPDEWVVIVDFQTDGVDPTEGVVIDHGSAKRAVYERLKSIDEHCGVFYTGEIRRGMIGLYAFEDVDEEDQ